MWRSRRPRGATFGALVCAVLAASVLPVSALAAGPSPAAASPRITVDPGSAPGLVRVHAGTRKPLALLAIEKGDRVARIGVVSRGTDFRNPAVWQRIGAGDVCWSEKPTAPTTDYLVREPTLPFRGPRGAWRYRAIVLFDEDVPRVIRKPRAGQVLSTGSTIRRVIVCVEARFAAAGRPRVDATATPSSTGSPTAAASASPTSSGTSVTTSSPSASATTTASTSIPPSPDPSDAMQGQKVTICHRTGSESNPYTSLTLSTNAVINAGHDTHSGPLYPQPGWGDIIPPFDGYGGMNWPAGAETLTAGCTLAPPTDPQPPGIDVDPPDPDKPVPPISPPIEIKPPGQVTPPIATLPPSASASASPSGSPSAVTPSAVTPSAVTPSPVPTVEGLRDDEVAFTLTNGYSVFVVVIPLDVIVEALEQTQPDPCRERARAEPRGC